MNIDILQKQEELLPELQACLSINGGLEGVPCLKHPLVFNIFHMPQMNAMMNESLRQKKKRCEKTIKEKDYYAYVWMHERPYRVQALKIGCMSLKDENRKEWWKLLGNVWVDSENIWQDRKFWEKELSTPCIEKCHIMEDSDRKELESIKQNSKGEITIYRGVHSNNSKLPNKKGISWTINKEKAIWFANRFNLKNNKVFKTNIKKEGIIALLKGRGEDEIIVNPSFLPSLKLKEVNKEIEKIIENIIE